MRLMGIFFMVCVLPLMGRNDFETGKYPEPPAGGIYDPDNWLTVEARNEMSRNIVISKEKWGTSVFVVILPDKPELGDVVFARKLGREWCDGRLWGLVLHVVGEPDFPKFFGELNRSPGWSGALVTDFEDSIKSAMEDVRKRASRESDQRMKVLKGTRELTDELGYLGLVMSRIDRNYDKVRGERRELQKVNRSNRFYFHRSLMIGVPLLLLVMAVATYLIGKKLRERKSNYLFPETSPRKRFLAPWAGGSDVLVQFDSRVGEDGSRKG